MGANTKIEWADHTASFWEGCTKVAPGCKNCYAERYERRMGRDVWGKLKPRKWTKSGPGLIRKLNRQAQEAGRVDTVFVNDLADFFEEHTGGVVDHRGHFLHRDPNSQQFYTDEVVRIGQSAVTIADLRAEAFKLFDECQNLIFMLLTKRPENILAMTPHVSWNACDSGDCPHEYWHDCDTEDQRKFRQNVWLGTSIADQDDANRNIPLLLKCRELSPVLFVSAEPLIGPVDLDAVPIVAAPGFFGSPLRWHHRGKCHADDGIPYPTIDWVIVGGESGPDSRMCDVQWIRDIRDPCQAFNVPVFIKQLGANVRWNGMQGGYGDGPSNTWPKALEMSREPKFEDVREGWRVNLKHPKGGDMSEWPEDLRVRQLPREVAA